MLKVEELIEPIASEALVRGIREHAQWKNFMFYQIKACPK
jgi:hypothetical protein